MTLKRLFLVTAMVLIVDSMQTPAQVTAKAEPTLVVNGAPIENAIRTIGGKTYVEVETIAKALNIRLQKSSTVVSLITGAPTSAPASSTTQISGSVSYYFNRNYGNKPDVGSKVYLLSTITQSLFQPSDSVFIVGDEVVIARTKEDVSKYKIVYSTAADGNGRYEFKGIEPGKYTLLAVSSHARGSTSSEILGKKLVRLVEIRAGQVVDISHDFGMTYY